MLHLSVMKQKNILKKEEYADLVKTYDDEVKKYNNIKKKKIKTLINLESILKKKLLKF